MMLKSKLSRDVYIARSKMPGLTQEKAAEALGICVREYQKIEKGVLLPGTEIFLKLLFFFVLDIEDYREEVQPYVFLPPFP